MKLIGKYLKPYLLIVVVCIGLLFAQAMSDLTLPNLMSDIVNVGIQQGGIEPGVPEAISEEGMSLLTHFMTDEEKTIFESAYNLVEPGTTEAKKAEKTYPDVKLNPVYILKNQKDISGVKAQADELYSKSSYGFMLMVSAIAEENGQSISNVSDEDGFANVDMSELYALLPMLDMAPKDDLLAYSAEAEASESLMQSQVGITFTKLFYSELGTDLDKVQQNYILSVGLKMLGIALLAAAAAVLLGFLTSRMAAKVGKKLRHDLFHKVQSFTNAELDKVSTASLITRTTNDAQQVQMLVTMGIRMLCYAPIMGVGSVIMAVQKSPSLSWIMAVVVLVMLGIILIALGLALPKFKVLQKLTDKLNLVSRENLTGMMVIRAFGNEEHEEKRFDSANKELADTNYFVQKVMAFLMPAMMLIMNITTLIIVWLGGHAIAESTMQIGDMLAFLQYAMHIIMSFLFVAMAFVFIPRALVSANRINEVLEIDNAVKDAPDAKNLQRVKGRVAFNNVSFKYGDAEESVIENVSFTAEPGKTTAFIGSTGSGKSTLINLIPRFYDVTEGSITIDGTDIRDISQKSLRDNIGYIPQKGFLFSGTIESNLKYGKEDATKSELEEAITVAQAKGFVLDEGDGITMPISQGATNVSGGQKQRLSIARALVKKAPIYIFDDSFSALDFKTDSALRAALGDFTGDSTVLIVAQRVSTIMSADQIIVLDQGRVAGIGTHRELLKTCPEYLEIAESQLQKEELA